MLPQESLGDLESLRRALARLRDEHQEHLRRMQAEGMTPAVRSDAVRLDMAILRHEGEICALQGLEYAEATVWLPPKAEFANSFVMFTTPFLCAIAIGGIAVGEEDRGWCLTFDNHYGARYEAINDEVLEGHRLHQKGLTPWRHHLIQNSQWLESLKKTQSVHSQYQESQYENVKHQLIVFKDRIVEVLAPDKPYCRACRSFEDAARLAVALTMKQV